MDQPSKSLNLDSPCDRQVTAGLRCGDRVLLSGVIVTARDMAHKHLVEVRPDEVRDVLQGAFIYHCGPVMVRDGAGWQAVSAGPTTSVREEPYEATVINEYGLRGVIGKGGMGRSTADALVTSGGVYLHATGGAGTSLASAVTAVPGVYFLDEFGVPEAMWVFRVRDFPVIVTMDSTGRSLHCDVYENSLKAMKGILGV